MTLDFVTLDVFTRHRFGGNPLAVVFDPHQHLDSAAMQAIAREFNLSETTFVQPPADPAHDARVRIFTPASEMPWAGHPNVGTAWALAVRTGVLPRQPRRWRFEEGAGVVTVEVDDADGDPIEARVLAPQALSLSAGPTVAEAARCLGLPRAALVAAGERVPVASVGFPFPLVELADRVALQRARPDLGAMGEVLLPLGLDGVIAYTRDVADPDHTAFDTEAPADATAEHAAHADLSVRMFAPLVGIIEDPATGSGVAALAAALAVAERADGLHRLSVAQGIDMGRPSALRTQVLVEQGYAAEVRVGGACVPVMEGRLHVA
ncbi:MAG: PhzF family phenazine biosynthesis protein [Ideonella sp.]|jgi:trans-2,3-dihydro-3-hydroxyanthranilate isomerase|nr:PhzF family phenazine biosynthesis protein [Ideonella sp.]